MSTKTINCKWCHKTLNTTHPDNELCDECSKYPNEEAMRKATITAPTRKG